MILIRYFRLLAFPFSLLYGFVVILRNWAYDYKIFKSSSCSIPVISVGNLVAGGSGKTPMTIYLAKKFLPDYKLAILSRGYGRTTKGFLIVHSNNSSEEVGDEPLQFKRQFPTVTVAVCENRLLAIRQLQKDHQLILMDDGYQHRAIKPGLSILLFDFNSLFKTQWLLPTGYLREPWWGKNRSDIIIVTKTSPDLDQVQRKQIIAKIDPQEHQNLFFSYLAYSDLVHIETASVIRGVDSITHTTQILLLTGIAKANYLVKYLEQYSPHVHHHEYLDHHIYTRKDIFKLVFAYNKLDTADRLIITTEKDVQRLKKPVFRTLLHNLPVYYLPVKTMIHDTDRHQFDHLMKAYMMKSSSKNKA